MAYKDFIQSRISNIQDTDLLSLAGAMGVGPWLVPLAPAIIFGWALYESTPAGMIKELSIIAGVTAAIGLIVAGAVSSHNAISLQSSGVQGHNLTFAWGLVFSYITLEISGLWLMAIEQNIKIVGTVISLLTLVVYLSRSSATKLSEIKQDRAQEKELQRENEQADQDHLREMEKLKLQAELQNDHVESMAKIEANKQKAIAKLTVQPGVQSSVQSVSNQNEQIMSVEDQKRTILNILANDPNTPIGHLTEHTGVNSRTTIYKRLDDLKNEGKIEKRNGAGYIVLNNE